MSFDTSVWYKQDIGRRLKPAMLHVFETWSGLSGRNLEGHLHRVRDKAWPLGEYPCIGQWMFILHGLCAIPQFESILGRLQTQETAPVILDIGCGLGQNLRLLAANGVSTSRMQAVDLNAELWELGYDLFCDKEKMPAQFTRVDFTLPFAAFPAALQRLRAQADVILTTQFLHLFDWDGQVDAIKKIVQLSRPGTVVVGYQQARWEARAYARPWGTMFYHNLDTFRRIWSLVGSETRTEWIVDAAQVELSQWGLEEEDVQWMPEDRSGLNFVVTRV